MGRWSWLFGLRRKRKARVHALLPVPFDLECFVCPLTREVFVDPWTDREGNTYEKAEIMRWLARSRTSPLTRSRLQPEQLVPNRSLKAACAALPALLHAAREKESQKVLKRRLAESDALLAAARSALAAVCELTAEGEGTWRDCEE